MTNKAAPTYGFDADEIAQVLTNTVKVLGLDPDNVTSIFLSPANIEVGFIKEPEVPLEVETDLLASMVWQTINFLGIDSGGLMALYMDPTQIKARYMDKELTIKPDPNKKWSHDSGVTINHDERNDTEE